MAVLTDSDRALLSQPLPAWVTTVRPDGSLHNTIVWMDVDGDDVVFTTLSDRAKWRHIKRDPRVSVSVLDPENAYRFVSVSGTAQIETSNVADVTKRMRAKYMPGTNPAPPEANRVVVRVKPEKVVRLSR